MATSNRTSGTTNLESSSLARANSIGSVITALKNAGASEIYLHTQIYNGRFFVDACGWIPDTKEVVTASTDTEV